MKTSQKLFPFVLLFFALSCAKEETKPTNNGNTNNGTTAAAPAFDASVVSTTEGITDVSFKISSTLKDNGGSAVTQHGHVWSDTKTEPTIADSKIELGATTGPFPLKFTSEIKSLKANTNYNVRAYATNNKGTTYGAVVQSKTNVAPVISNNKDAKVILVMDSYQIYAINASNQIRLWTKGRSGVSSYAASTLDNSTAYISWNNSTEAYDILTGVKKWEYINNKIEESFYSTPLIYKDLLLVGSTDQNSYNVLYALDLKTGQKKWEVKNNGSSISSPTIIDDILYYGSNHVYAINPNTGVQIWRFTLPSGTNSSPAVAGGVVYVGATNGMVYGLDSKTGSKKWEFKTDGTFITSSPTVANNIVYIGSTDDKKVFALDANTGMKKWEFLTGSSVLSSPWVEKGILYIGSSDKKLYALDAETGAKKWDFLMNLGNTDNATSPVIVNGVLYMSSNYDKKLYALNSITGAKIWETTFRDAIISSPAILTNDGNTVLSGISGIKQ